MYTHYVFCERTDFSIDNGSDYNWSVIERFDSRDQYLCKCIGTKEKSSTPTALVWNTNMASVLLFWNTNMAAVTSCESTLLVANKKNSQKFDIS